jgi:phosphoenolpyruvate-protein kinase (PTS system EI component)
MELTEILMMLLSGTTVGGIASAIAYRRQNKKLKENEVKKDDVDTQREQINLAEDYMKKVMELSEMNYEQAKKNGTDNEEILKMINAVAEEQKHIIMYLNGDYQGFLERNGFNKA